MKTIEVNINGRFYNLACDDGQEDRLRKLAHQLDMRLKEMRNRVPGIQDSMLWVMVGLMMSDELQDVKQENQLIKQQLGSKGVALPEGLATPSLPSGMIAEEEFVSLVDSIAIRIEAIAAGLENG